jgi:lipopolysaccharide export system protein LptA
MKATLPALTIALTLGLLALPVAAAPTPKPAASADAQHMDIVAQTTTYDGKAHTYQVKGKVTITLPQLVVTCDEATVFADATESQVLKVVFTGNVEAKKGTDSFKASRITYHVGDRRLIAEGTTRTRLKLPEKAQGPITGP